MEIESAPRAASLRDVGVRFANASSASWALAQIDLDLLPGLTVLVGPNGAGKTTLLRILAGLLVPDSGTVEIPGDRRSLRRRMGYIPQEVALDPEMTGRETLWLLAALHGVPRRERDERIARLAESFGTEEHLPRPVAVWSGGLKRRLHLAAGMIHDPELLLLDEPTVGLDLEGTDFLWTELERRAAAGRAVAVVTHDLAAAERHAHQVIILDKGKIVASGAPEELGPALVQTYRRLTGRDPEGPRTGGGGGGGRRGRGAG
ncbi:MAG TPA: ABC transporter ATP-binding protein [Thermoanaerobaculia bacterium]|nr:ABC transporter ATP-binding protein [Thermoanaerobaculia bacterium]